MSLNEKDISIIEKHLRHSLSSEERSYFESRLTDSEFSKELSYQQDLLIAFKASGREHKKKQLQELEQSLAIKSNPEVLKKGVSKRNWMLLVLGILGLALLFYFLSDQKSPPKNEQLYAQYAEPYPNVIFSITRDSDSPENQPNPYQLYEQGNYPEAIAAFNQTKENSPADNYYLALSYLFNKEIAKSETILNDIIGTSDHQFRQPAQWYMAMIHLQQNEIAECRALLNTISQVEDHPFANKASQLLEKL